MEKVNKNESSLESDSLRADLDKGMRILREGMILFLLSLICTLFFPILDIVNHFDPVDISSETNLFVFTFKIISSVFVFLFGIPGVIEILIGMNKIDKSKSIFPNNSKVFFLSFAVGLLFTSLVGFILAMVFSSLGTVIYTNNQYTNIYLDIIYFVTAVFQVGFIFFTDKVLINKFQTDSFSKRQFIPNIVSFVMLIIWLGLFITKVAIFISSSYSAYDFKLYLSIWLYLVSNAQLVFALACIISVLVSTLLFCRLYKEKIKT